MNDMANSVFDRWIGKADENIDEWGLQDERTLLLAMQEELGELTQAYLEASAEGGEAARIDKELDDLAALLLQFHETRNNRPEDTGVSRMSKGGAESDEAGRYTVGNDIARRSRTETPRMDVLRDELPELSKKELRVLDDNIEKAIRDVVVSELREQSICADTEEGGRDV
jgi:hypothetical protein